MNNLLVILFVGCLALSFFLSGMEAGVFALSRLRIRHWMRQGNRRAEALYGYLENPENFLWTILIGNTLANVLAVSIGMTWLHLALLGNPWLLLPALTAGVLVFYAGCELLPKMLFRLYPNRLCMTLAVPFRMVHLVLSPLVGAVALFARTLLRWSGGRRFTGHLFGNREELRFVMQESAQALSSDERVMINRVLDLQNRTVQQVATPMTRAVTVSAETPVDAVLALARERGFSRLPVWKTEGDRKRIAGLLNVRTLLFNEAVDGQKAAADFLKPALYLEEETRLEVALRQMQRTGQRLAIVLGRERTETGVVSLQDILGALFGEVRL